MRPNRPVPDVQEKRRKFAETIKNIPAERIVVLDESSVNINMQRRYGRAIGGARVADSSPVNRPVSRTVISGLTLNGPIAFSTWIGGTTKGRFEAYVDKVLVPELAPGSIVILDNLSAHHASRVRELIENAGASVLYTPPYSPDMNPIEMCWSKMKTILRGERIRSSEFLLVAVEDALTQTTTADCRGWFAHDGYCVPGYRKRQPA